MKKLLTLTTALTAVATIATAEEVTVMSWGGAYVTSQIEAYHKPFTAETGINVISVDADNPATPVKAMVEANNVTVDVADVEYADAVRLCDEGMLETIDPAILAPAPDGTPAAEDFLPGALTECAVATIVFSTVFAYDTSKFPEGPTTMADFFDLEKFPGKRGMRKGAKANLEMALMADGVPAAEVYALLETDEGLDRAFAKLETIKDQVIWWEAGAQPPQLLADQAKWISYGPARKSSAPLVGLYQDGKTEMGPHMPTAPENMTNALASSYEFWVDRDAELNERFNAWLAAN